MRASYRIVFGFGLVVCLIIIGININGSMTVTPRPQLTIPPSLGPNPELVEVTRIVDGDTIEVNYHNKLTKLRYIGIDTPKTVDPHRPVGYFSHEASNEDKKRVLGQEVVCG